MGVSQVSSSAHTFTRTEAIDTSRVLPTTDLPNRNPGYLFPDSRSYLNDLRTVRPARVVAVPTGWRAYCALRMGLGVARRFTDRIVLRTGCIARRTGLGGVLVESSCQTALPDRKRIAEASRWRGRTRPIAAHVPPVSLLFDTRVLPAATQPTSHC